MQVNSYILTFKKKILLFFILVIGIIVVIDYSLSILIAKKTTKTTFFSNKTSKIKHFELNTNINQRKDIVFIGSSRTFYHISTNVFNKYKMNIYNFGISGTQYEDYPALIASINKVNPKNVVISISIHSLFEELRISNYPTLTEITYYWSIDKLKFIKSLEKYFVSLHTFLRYSEPIYYKIESIYHRFDKKINKNKLMLRGSNNIYNYSQIADCKIFDIKKISNIQTILKCTNGDGILIGQSHINLLNNNKNISLSHLNKETIVYIKKLVNNFNKNINVTIILEPILHNPYRYNMIDIKKQFRNIQIIDLTNYIIDDHYWIDNDHLNYKGRIMYSNFLAKLLQKENKQ